MRESPADKALYQEVYGKNQNDGNSTMRVKWAFDSTKEMRSNGQLDMRI